MVNYSTIYPLGGGGSGGGRELLTANRTYFVRTDGNDSNNGLTNTSGGAFLTIQKAVDTAAALDLSIYDVTIRVGTGTFTDPIVLKTLVGSGLVTIRGDANNNTSTVISVTNADAISGTYNGRYAVNNLRLTTITLGDCLSPEGYCEYGPIEFGSSAGAHIVLDSALSQIRCKGDYTISGDAGAHIYALRSGYLLCDFKTLTLIGTPTFADVFMWAGYCAQILYYSMTYSGSAIGTRYRSSLNGVIFTGGQTLPGSVDGSKQTGGQYV